MENRYWNKVWSGLMSQMKAKLAILSIAMLLFVAVFADFLANEKPIYLNYQGTSYFPLTASYFEALGLKEKDQALLNIDYKTLDAENVVWPLIPYSPNNLDLENSKSIGPFDEQVLRPGYTHHYLGTDEIGRDVLSGMVHGARYVVSIGFVSMGIAAILGLFFGSIGAYYGDQSYRISRGRLIIALIATFAFWFYGIYHPLQQIESSGLLQLLLKSAVLLLFCIVLTKIIADQLERLPWMNEKISVPFDLSISRLIEIIVTIPTLFLILSIVAIAKPSIYLIMVVIGFTQWTRIARFVRAEILKVKNLEYIEASKALGYSDYRIIMKHVLPNTLSPVLISISFGIASAILIEATLSFLGIGVPAETVTWGSILSQAKGMASSVPWWLVIVPGFAIFYTVTVFNIVGEGIADAMNPKRRNN